MSKYSGLPSAAVVSLQDAAVTTSRSPLFTTNSPNEQCDICSSQPCYNGGTCHVSAASPWKSYWCECLPSFAGTQCQTPIVCQPDSCGRNTSCYVANHQLNCICKDGYSGKTMPFLLFADYLKAFTNVFFQEIQDEDAQ
ncbi:unnamed protein product [Strongylus vulgaris]|uniref:EGF-like domain-containing protein n=1 Tax=Strongylus vulgaris TaxID=40348 RepID=A0A3P7JLJ3_STRVU|nr:unnamed protein product [Strongylus vulgaris]